MASSVLREWESLPSTCLQHFCKVTQDAVGPWSHQGVLLARVQFIHQDTPLHHHHLGSLQSCFSQGGSSLHWCLKLFLPRSRTLHWHLNTMRLPSAHFPSLSRSLWLQHTYCIPVFLQTSVLFVQSSWLINVAWLGGNSVAVSFWELNTGSIDSGVPWRPMFCVGFQG